MKKAKHPTPFLMGHPVLSLNREGIITVSKVMRHLLDLIEP